MRPAIFTRTVSVTLAGLFVLAASACQHVNVPCASNEDCDLAADGECKPSPGGATWCTYPSPDPSCSTGRQWSDYEVGEGLGGTCFQPEPSPPPPPPPDAAPDAPWECVPNTGVCADNKATRCGPDGKYLPVETCALGCFTDNTRCWQVNPVNGVATQLDDARNHADVVLTDGATIDTDSGKVINGDKSEVTVVSEMVGNARVFKFRSLTLNDVTVSGAPAIVLVSHDKVIIGGLVSIAGYRRSPGPGGRFWDCRKPYKPDDGDGLFGNGPAESTGGSGGGGNGTAGGQGGINNDPRYGTGGKALEDTALKGGGSGGLVLWSEDGMTKCVAAGGAGGGALQISSQTAIEIRADALGVGVINGSGSGGGGRGGGGGAGGTVILEAPRVDFVGAKAGVVVNGGGGGGGCGSSEGSNGLISADAASGGTCTGNFMNGGRGGSIRSSAEPGISYTGDKHPSGAGGGGGAVGRILIHTSDAKYKVEDETLLSGMILPNLLGRR